jgi:hypothetical protein
MSGALGHWVHKDSRDALYGMSGFLPAFQLLPTSMVWERGASLNQGREGACVGFGWANWHNCKPKGWMNQVDNEYAFNWYKRAQQLDPFFGEDYDGTTVRAGARVAQERDLLDTYVWARSLDELDAWVLTKGPLVVASNWYYSMDRITSSNEVYVTPSSGIRGGHCYLLYGKEGNTYHFQNSWGDSYGDSGSFYMNRANLSTLWNVGQFEAVTALQTKVA